MARRKTQAEEQVVARIPYEKYHVKITLLTPLLGSAPKKQKALKESGIEIDPSDETILFDEEKGLTGFHSVVIGTVEIYFFFQNGCCNAPLCDLFR